MPLINIRLILLKQRNWHEINDFWEIKYIS